VLQSTTKQRYVFCRGERSAYRDRDHLEDMGVDRKIILK
jgi:hypothetical protein